MGASLVYLNEPIKEVEHEEGSNNYIKFAASQMQGWRLNMVSTWWTHILFSIQIIMLTSVFEIGGCPHRRSKLQQQKQFALWGL